MLLKQTILFILLFHSNTIEAFSFYTNFVISQLAMREIMDMPVAALRDEIRLRGGKAAGLKSELIERLTELQTSNSFINDEGLEGEETKEDDEEYKAPADDNDDDADEELKESPTDEVDTQNVS